MRAVIQHRDRRFHSGCGNTDGKLRKNVAAATTPLLSVENDPVLRVGFRWSCTVRESEDCYTFEQFAGTCPLIRSTYHYHYKRNTSGLKEEAKWS